MCVCNILNALASVLALEELMSARHEQQKVFFVAGARLGTMVHELWHLMHQLVEVRISQYSVPGLVLQ